MQNIPQHNDTTDLVPATCVQFQGNESTHPLGNLWRCGPCVRTWSKVSSPARPHVTGPIRANQQHHNSPTRCQEKSCNELKKKKDLGGDTLVRKMPDIPAIVALDGDVCRKVAAHGLQQNKKRNNDNNTTRHNNKSKRSQHHCENA